MTERRLSKIWEGVSCFLREYKWALCGDYTPQVLTSTWFQTPWYWMLDVLGTLGFSFIIAFVWVKRAYSSGLLGAPHLTLNSTYVLWTSEDSKEELILTPHYLAPPPTSAGLLRYALFTFRLLRRKSICWNKVGSPEIGEDPPYSTTYELSMMLYRLEGHPVQKSVDTMAGACLTILNARPLCGL